VPEYARRHRTIAFDHRGWGLSLDTTDGGPESFTADLLALLEHLEIEKALLVGQSMGGYACLQLALKQPDRVNGVVMANTFAGMRREVWLNSSEEQHEAVRRVWDRRRETGVKRALAPEFSRKHREMAFLYRQIRLLNENGPNRLESAPRIARLTALERDLAVSATREQLAAMKVPVLFIGGEHDEVMPVTLMEIAHSLTPSSRMTVVPGAGHSVYFEAAEMFTHVTLEFFQTCLDL
jgi:3-oxoadipate enol-lactonase